MGGLFSSLNTSLDTLRALQQSLQVAQNNVSNASTPGYTKQVPSLVAKAFEANTGLAGGVQSGYIQSTRDEYLDQAVRLQNELQGGYTAQSEVLSQVQTLFDVSGQSGVGGALSSLLQSFSSWGANPDSTVARQDVLVKAQGLATSFQQAAAFLSSSTQSVNSKINATVQQINTLASQIAGYNLQKEQSFGALNDPGLDAQVHSALETLSGLTGATARFESNGTVTVLLGGQSPLVIGDQAYKIQTSYADTAVPVNANAPPSAHILDSTGQEITGQASGGTLGGLLTVRNNILPSLQGDGQQPGAFNQLAKQIADSVNNLLESGTTSGGQAGIALFTYDSTGATNAARSLSVNPALDVSGLAPVDPGPPSVSNGIALKLANLGDSTNPANTIANQSINGFYGSVTAQVGQWSANAQQGQEQSTQSLAQAKSFRDTVSGVSLDQEAVQVMELQRGFNAASKMISVIDQLSQTLMNMVH